jgi:inosine-uridine nucleoside N-ribohydrolase
MTLHDRMNPAAKYLANVHDSFSYCWDELAAAAWLDPAIIMKEEMLYLDVNLGYGPFYGDTRSLECGE